MMNDLTLVRTLYRKLVRLYPRPFREQLGESMQQTFHDLYRERQSQPDRFGFVAGTFIETAIGIFREHLLLVSPGVIMQLMFTNIGFSALISLLLILPLMIMEVVNRRAFDEGFPGFLFFAMWLNLFAVSVILLPIVQGWRRGNRDTVDPISGPGNTFITRPGSAAILSIIVFLSPGILPLLGSMGWLSLDRLFNGPNPEVTYLPGMFLVVGLALFPIAAGIIVGRPIVHSLRAGASLFAHPINLMIVVVIAAIFAFGFISFLIDQWPCFIGVPNCD